MNKYLHSQRTGGGTGASIFIWTPCRGQAQWKSCHQLRTGSGRYMVSCPFFFFFWRFFNFKIAPHFTAGKSFSSHQHFENTKLENFFLEHKLSAEVALHLTWKEKLAFTKLQQFLAYSCSKADIWDASLILVATKVLFSSLMFWGNTWLFSLFLATKTYRCNLCLSRKKMEIKSVHQIWYDENYCHTIKII